MKDTFGPWCTGMTNGPKLELSTFWKRRMASLPQLGRANATVS